jgi:hypothetical protein
VAEIHSQRQRRFLFLNNQAQKGSNMKMLLTFLLLAVAVSVCGAQWIENESMVARRAADNNHLVEPAAVWPYRNQSAYPAGHFIIKPDNNGQLNFDTTLARGFQRAIDSIGLLWGVRGMSAAVLIPSQGIGDDNVSNFDSLEFLQNIGRYHGHVSAGVNPQHDLRREMAASWFQSKCESGEVCGILRSIRELLHALDLCRARRA